MSWHGAVLGRPCAKVTAARTLEVMFFVVVVLFHFNKKIQCPEMLLI